MRLIQFISVIFILFIVACNNNRSIDNTEKTKPVNALLPTDVTVRHLFAFHPQDEEWIKSFDYTKFIDDITTAAKEEKIKVYDFFGTYEINMVPMPIADLQINLTGGVDTIYIEDPETFELEKKIFERSYPQEEINQIFFKEEWMLDKDSFKLSKDVIGYGIVRVYNRQYGEEVKEVKKILFELNLDKTDEDIKDKEQIAKNIKYEFTLDNFEWVKNLDHAKFINILLEKIDSGDVKAFDFYDNSKLLTIKNIKDNMGLVSDTIYMENPETFDLELKIIDYDITPDLFGSYIFIEDWYLDRTTFKIFKDVKGIAPVYFMYREDGELSKKIPFVVWF